MNPLQDAALPDAPLGLSLRQHLQQLDAVRKENFALKMKLYNSEQGMADKDNSKLEAQVQLLSENLKRSQDVLSRVVQDNKEKDEKIVQLERKIQEQEFLLAKFFTSNQDQVEVNVDSCKPLESSTKKILQPSGCKFPILQSNEEWELYNFGVTLLPKAASIPNYVEHRFYNFKTHLEELHSHTNEVEELQSTIQTTNEQKDYLVSQNEKMKETLKELASNSLWILLQKGIAAAKSKDVSVVADVVDKIKEYFSSKLSMPIEKVFPEPNSGQELKLKAEKHSMPMVPEPTNSGWALKLKAEHGNEKFATHLQLDTEASTLLSPWVTLRRNENSRVSNIHRKTDTKFQTQQEAFDSF